MQHETAHLDDMGARIRAERDRLGFSQADFSSLGGASRRALVEWEKGRSSPNAEVLAKWLSAKVDILYILTGHRAFARRSSSSANEAECRMDQIEASLAANEVPQTPQQQASPDHTSLTAIALDDEMPDRTRARADLILRLAYGDSGAEARDAARAARTAQERRKAEVVVSDAARSAGWEPPPVLRGHLVRLVYEYQVHGDTIAHLLYDLGRLAAKL